jgi:CheY-like chemotaxis protein
VDDELEILRLFEDALTAAGHRVVTANNGPEGLLHAAGGTFDVAFLDIKMPGLNGAETLTRMRQVAPKTAVVMITGYAESELLDQALDGGARFCLFKPFTVAQILGLVSDIVGAS